MLFSILNTSWTQSCDLSMSTQWAGLWLHIMDTVCIHLGHSTCKYIMNTVWVHLGHSMDTSWTQYMYIMYIVQADIGHRMGTCWTQYWYIIHTVWVHIAHST